jgi:predicted nucleotidyltransferase
MNLGLRKGDLKYIISAVEKFEEIEKALIFGSRAMGNYKRGSDVDLAIIGEKINFDTVSRLHAILEDESPMPYFFDVVDYSHLDHQELKEHIGRMGKIIFVR